MRYVCVSSYISTYIHLYIHTYIHTYIHSFIHKCIQVTLETHMSGQATICVANKKIVEEVTHIHIHIHIHIYILKTYIHATNTHTLTHTYLHTYTVPEDTSNGGLKCFYGAWRWVWRRWWRWIATTLISCTIIFSRQSTILCGTCLYMYMYGYGYASMALTQRWVRRKWLSIFQIKSTRKWKQDEMLSWNLTMDERALPRKVHSS